VADALLAHYAHLLSTLAPGEVEPIATDTDRATVGEHLVIGTLSLRATFDDQAPHGT